MQHTLDFGWVENEPVQALFDGSPIRYLSEESSGYVETDNGGSFYGFYGVLAEFDDLFE